MPLNDYCDGCPPKMESKRAQDSYAAFLNQLYAIRRHGVKLQLDRIRECLARLGEPHKQLAIIIQIGGTNGKGSTAHFVDAILRSAGIKTGLFTSPHLVQFSERFRIAGKPVNEDQIEALGRRILEFHDEIPVTFFEIATAMALQFFAQAQVDVSILEVGLGGKYDATNAIDAHVAAVTGVALDHQAYLGNTLEDIAAEKAGIFKPNQHVVIGASGEPGAIPFLVHAAAEIGAKTICRVDESEQGESLPKSLRGFQHANARCALAIVNALSKHAPGLQLMSDTYTQALRDTTPPGRIETIAQAPQILIDGAHNPHGAKQLANDLEKGQEAPSRCLLVIGISRDKDIRGIVMPLLKVVNFVIATQARDSRAVPAEQLGAMIAKFPWHGELQVVPDTKAALTKARQWATPEDRIVVAGSLFVVGEIRAQVLGLRPDPIPLSDPM